MPRKTSNKRTRPDPEPDLEEGGLSAWLMPGLRVAARRPVDSAGILLAMAASGAILVNALFLQSGRHPAPLLGHRALPASQSTLTRSEATGALDTVLPRPRPAASPDLRTATAAAPVTADPRARNDVIVEIQRELARRGFYNGMADGIWGPMTDAAAHAFAQQAKLTVIVEPGERLLHAITGSPVRDTAHAAPPPTPPATVPASPGRAAPAAGVGTRQMMAVQRALSDFGYGQIRPTGIDGPETRAAIEVFERERNLPVTGRLSPRMVRELSAMTGRPLE